MRDVRKFFSILLVFFTVSFVFAEQNDDIAGIIRKGELRVVITSTDQPPFYFVNKAGKLVGYDIDLATRIADELNVKLVISRDAPTFNDLVTLVSQDKADLAISKLSRTLSRAKIVKFSSPYMVFKQGLLFNRLQLAKVASESNVSKFVRNYDGTIGVIAKSSYVNYARENFPKAQIKEYKTWDDAVEALYKGEVLSIYRDELEIKKVLESVPNSSLLFKPIYFTDLTDPIAIAVKTESSQLLYWINIFLERENSVKPEEILKKYQNQ